MTNDEYFMSLALNEARLAFDEGEVPVGAVIVKDGEVISVSHNLREKNTSATAHAELICIQAACEALKSWRLSDCTLYVTLEPCPMCAGAIINSRIKRVVYGADDKKAGSVGSVINLFELDYNHKPYVKSGILKEECSDILKQFFSKLRAK